MIDDGRKDMVPDKMPKHTPGAIKAAQRIVDNVRPIQDDNPSWLRQLVEESATIIDEETAAPTQAARIKELETENDKFVDRIEELKDENDKLEDQVSDLTDRVNELDDQVSEQKEQIAELEEMP